MKFVSLGTSPLMSKGLLTGFNKAGHEIDTFSFQNWPDLSEEEGVNQFKINLESTKPDYVIMGGYGPKYFGVLPDLCKEKGIGLIYWAIEDPVSFNETLFIAEKADHIFTTAIEMIEKYKAIGLNAQLLTFACNPDYHRKGNYQQKYDMDLSLVASFYKWEARYEGYEIILDAAKKSSGSLNVWGAGWESERGHEVLKDMSLYQGYFQNSHLPDLCASCKIILGIQCDDSSITQTSMRPYEVLGCGGFHLTQWTKATDNIFEDGQHLVTAKTKEEAFEKIKYYINNTEERSRIAQNGQDFVYKYHTYERRVKDLILPNI